MPTMLDPGQDERGKELVEHGSHTADMDQIEAYANDPNNATKKPSNPNDNSNTSSAGSNSAAKSSGGSQSGGSGSPLGGSGGGAGNPLAGGSPQSKGGLSGLMGGLKKRKKTVLLAGGGAFAIGGLMVFGALFAIPFKLIHLREVMNQYFGQRQTHMAEKRVGKLWQVVVDKDGNHTYAKNTGHPLADFVYNVNSNRLVTDMKARGVNLSLDPTTHKILLDGKAIDGDLKDRRSTVRQTLNEAYPDDGYFRRSTRAARTFHIYGIKRRFFENKREKVDDWEKEMKTKIRERLFGSASDDISARARKSAGSPDNATNKALDELNTAVGPDAAKAKADALAHPELPIPEVDPSLEPSKLISIGATDAVKSSVNATAFLTAACTFKNFLTDIIVGAKALRSESLARYAGMILTAGDQLKVADEVNYKGFNPNGINGNELNVLMKSLDGVEQGGGYQIASQANPNATVKTQAKYSLDISKQGGRGGFFVNLNNKIDSIPGVKGTCKFATQTWFVILSTLVTITADFFTAGGISIASLAANATVSEIVGIASAIVKPMAVQMLAGMTVTGDEPAADRGDALTAGSDIIFNTMVRANGGHTLDKQQAMIMDEQIAAERSYDTAHQSLAAKFNLDNPYSPVARLAFATPTSLSDVTNLFNSYTASINPFLHRNSPQNNGLLSLFFPSANAYAPSLDDPFGVDQMAITDAEFDNPAVADPIANEKFILDDPGNKQKYDDYVQKCAVPVAVDDADQTMCNAQDDLTTRLRVYHFDKGLGSGMAYMSGAIDTLPDLDGTGDGSNTPAAGGTLVGGTAQDLAKQVLALAAAGKIIIQQEEDRQDLQNTADGKPITACNLNGELNTTLLKIIVTAAQTNTFSINALVTGHTTGGGGCDGGYHDKGRAVDIGNVNGVVTNDKTLATAPYKQFAQYITGLLPLGGGLGQQQYIGPLNPSPPRYFPDYLNHMHIDVGDTAP